MRQTAHIHDVFSDGSKISYTINEIIPGIELVIYYEAGEAVLRINDEDAVEFRYTKEAAAMFADIDTAGPIKLLEMLSRLNKSLVQKYEDARMNRKAAM